MCMCRYYSSPLNLRRNRGETQQRITQRGRHESIVIVAETVGEKNLYWNGEWFLDYVFGVDLPCLTPSKTKRRYRVSCNNR